MPEEKFGHDTYLSPFTWRYGSAEMRKIFSEKHYRAIWRKIWAALAETQYNYGLITKEELQDIKKHSSENYIDLKRAHEIEKEIGHDLMAELKTFAEQSKVGGGKLHLGATSADIEDNADIIRIRSALAIIRRRIVECLAELSKRIEKNHAIPCMGWTHLQPAEPTTLGYRFAVYAQDLLLDLKLLDFVSATFVKGKGMKGAVGTSASYASLLKSGRSAAKLEEIIMQKLGLQAHPIGTQTYPRKIDFVVISLLASIAQSVHKFCLDVRVLQSPPFGELSEPFGAKQVGSSAMPFKRNPVSAERACSLARYVSTLPPVAFSNASSSIFERTLDDSANRRIIIPEAFLAVDECLRQYVKIASGMQIYYARIKANLGAYSPYASIEPLLMEAAKRGADRQKMHERFRTLSVKAWEDVQKGKPNPLPDLIKKDKEIANYLTKKKVEELMDPSSHTGDASERALEFVKNEVKPLLKVLHKKH